MDHVHTQSVSKQSSKLEHCLIDVEDNLENRRAMDRSLVEFYRSDHSLVKLLPPKKRPFKENGAHDVVGDNLEDQCARDKSGILVHCEDHEHALPPKERPFLKEGQIRTAASEGTPTSKIGDKDRFRADTASSVRKKNRGFGGVEGSGKNECGRKEENKCGTCSKTGSSAVFGSDSEVTDADSKGTPRRIVVDKNCFLADTPDSMWIENWGMRRKRGNRKKKSTGDEKRYGSSLKRKDRDGDLKNMSGEIIADNSEAKEGKKDEEIEELFNMGKKKKKTERHPEEIALVEQVMAELKAAAEEDAELNREGKPAINIPKKLHLLTENLSKKHLLQEFLDHGVVNLLKTWLEEPLPDLSIPNININKKILNILFDLSIDTKQYEIRDQMKNGLAEAVMYLSQSDEESLSNRKLAKDLIKKWSSQSFDKNTNIKDMRNINDESFPLQRPSVKMPPSKGAKMKSRLDNNSGKFSRGHESSPLSSSKRAVRPEPMSVDSDVKRPQSSINHDAVRALNQQAARNKTRHMADKKL